MHQNDDHGICNPNKTIQKVKTMMEIRNDGILSALAILKLDLITQFIVITRFKLRLIQIWLPYFYKF